MQMHMSFDLPAAAPLAASALTTLLPRVRQRTKMGAPAYAQQHLRHCNAAPAQPWPVTAMLLCRHNGRYVQTEGMMEQVLVDKMAGFLKKRAADEQPFFMYYAPYAIHKK